MIDPARLVKLKAAARWTMLAGALLVPGSFVFLPVLWYLKSRAARQRALPGP